jgi:lipid-A-disaccharide synthase
MNDVSKPLTVYMIAGEPSGDLLGAHLMAALKKEAKRPVRFFGVGGDRMQAEGLTSLFLYHELALLGFLEILPSVMRILARVQLTADDILAKAPDVVITIDVPGFSKRVVKKLKQHHYKCPYIHYVAPSVWAYRPGRAQKFAGLYDHLLTLLPFEPPYFEKVGLSARFVGHPVVAETTASGDANAFRTRYQLAENTPLICLLPGSRKGEVARHMPIFAQAINIIAETLPNLAMVIPVPKHMLDVIGPYFRGCPYRTIITADEQDKKDAISASHLAIVKSGTVALEVAMAKIPMVIAYRVNPISAFIFRRIRLTKFANLVNIILGYEAIPELLQEHCTPLLIASAASDLLNSPARIEAQKNAIDIALKQMVASTETTPSELAAREIMAHLS